MKKLMMLVVASSIIWGASLPVQAAPGPHKNHRYHAPVKHLPLGAVAVVLNGINYWLSDGVYYRKEGKTYVSVVSPPGAKVRQLPNGAVVGVKGGKKYFHHSGIYYRWKPSSRHYEVVEIVDRSKVAKPVYGLGSVLQSLPEGASATTVNGIQYFELQGQYFMPSERNGDSVYVVVDIAER